MPDIAKINAVAIADIEKVDGILAANIEKVNGLTIPSAAAFLLDVYSGATGAWSTRRLNSNYTGACMRVREDSGDTEADIGFDSNGDLDTAALATHCGSANGYVKTWYGQESSGGTGSGTDATQTTKATQPQIYNGTSELTDNGKPALVFNGDKFPLSLTLDAGECSVFMVGQYATTTGNRMMLSLGGSSPYWFHYAVNLEYRTGYGSAALATKLSNSAQLQYLWTSIVGSTQGDFRSYRNTSPTIPASVTRTTGTLPNTNTGIGFWQTWGNHNGPIQEIVIYGSDQSGNRTGIQTNINGHFSIYT